jgi:hypothetical protein
MRDVCGMSRLGVGLCISTAFLGAFLLGVTSAAAGIGGSNVPTWPGTATVGDVIRGSVFVTNISTAPNNTEDVTLTALFVNPACASGVSSVCIAGNTDPGIFKVIAAEGDEGTAPCAGTTSRSVPRTARPGR